MKYLKYFLIGIIIFGGFTAKASLAQQIPEVCDLYTYQCSADDARDMSQCDTSSAVCCDVTYQYNDKNNGLQLLKDKSCDTLNDGNWGVSATQVSKDKCLKNYTCCCHTQPTIQKCEYKCQSKSSLVSSNTFCGSAYDSSLGGNYNSAGCSASQPNTCNASTEYPVCCCTNPAPAPQTPLVDSSQVSDKIIPINFTPEVSIPNSIFNNTKSIPVGSATDVTKNGIKTTTMSSTLLSSYIQALYNYGLAIAAILAAIVLMGGGLLWLTSGGDSGRITKAKEMIIGAITGLVILFCAWIILNTINPDLLKLKPIKTVAVTKIAYCCDPSTGNVLMDQATKKCPANAPMCASGSSCMATTVNNNYGCMKDSDYNCCEYYSSDGRTKCEPVKAVGGKCSAPKGYKLKATDMGRYCMPQALLGDVSCLNSCEGKSNGDTCQAPPSVMCRCFNESPFYGSSLKEGDYCGNRGSKTSKCYTKTCDELKLKADHVMNFKTIAAINPLYDYYQLFFGTDDCGKSLHCCGK